jgi:hypothetical protein
VCFNEEPKLRTVLWGWVDQPILQPHLANLVTLQQTLGDFHDQIDPFLSRAESHELRQRIGGLLKTKSFPQPSAQWPAIPWPVF